MTSLNSPDSIRAAAELIIVLAWIFHVRHEVACRSCSYFSRKEPSMSLDESTVLNQVRIGQSNEASRGAGYKS